MDNSQHGPRTHCHSMLEDIGCLVLRRAVPDDAMAALQELVTQRISAAESALLENHSERIRLGETEFMFKEMSSRGGQRFDLLVDVPPPLLQRIDATWRHLVADTLGCVAADVHCQISIVYSKPGAPCQDWHSDGAHIQADAGWGVDDDRRSPDLAPRAAGGSVVCRDGSDASATTATPSLPSHAAKQSRAYAVCVFVPMIDLDDTVGYTSFYPCSHRHKGLVGFGPAASVLQTEVHGIVPKGSAVLYDYRLLHRGMSNQSSATQRELVQFLYSVPWYAEAKNYGSEPLFE
eukprot:m.1270410 g.1270410  ORF g.1270410 m.1270410 type:complete len:291 (+) comp24749_c0_seq26:1118-1990(+)